MSSTVSAFTTKKLPSFKPTAKAFPSGEKAQHLPPATGSEKIIILSTLLLIKADGDMGESRYVHHTLMCDRAFNTTQVGIQISSFGD